MNRKILDLMCRAAWYRNKEASATSPDKAPPGSYDKITGSKRKGVIQKDMEAALDALIRAGYIEENDHGPSSSSGKSVTRSSPPL